VLTTLNVGIKPDDILLNFDQEGVRVTKADPRNWHTFKSNQVTADDKSYPLHVIIQQARFFGPFPISYEDFIDEEQDRILGAVLLHVEEEGSRKPFFMAEDDKITRDDKKFIYKIMEMKP